MHVYLCCLDSLYPLHPILINKAMEVPHVAASERWLSEQVDMA